MQYSTGTELRINIKWNPHITDHFITKTRYNVDILQPTHSETLAGKRTPIQRTPYTTHFHSPLALRSIGAPCTVKYEILDVFYSQLLSNWKLKKNTEYRKPTRIILRKICSISFILKVLFTLGFVLQTQSLNLFTSSSHHGCDWTSVNDFWPGF